MPATTPTTRPKRRWLRWLIALLLALLVWLLAVAAAIWSYASRSDAQPSDAIVVLGASAPQGVPSPVFAARIDHAITLQQPGVAPRIVFPGGAGAGESISEAQAAQTYALARGVPAAAMLLETQSQTTQQNLSGAAPLLQQAGAKRVLLVSDPLHMRRAVVLARRQGLDAHPAPTPSTRYQSLGAKLGMLARETWFYALLLLGQSR